MIDTAFDFTCEDCGTQSTGWTEDLRSDPTVQCTSCGAVNDGSAVIPDAVRSAIEQTLDTRWPGAYLGLDVEDWTTGTHCFHISSDDRQHRLIVGDRVRRSSDVRGAIHAIRTKERRWIRLLKESGCVRFGMRKDNEYVFDACLEGQ